MLLLHTKYLFTVNVSGHAQQKGKVLLKYRVSTLPKITRSNENYSAHTNNILRYKNLLL